MVLQVGGSLLSGADQKNQYKASARADEENARLTMLQAGYDSAQLRRDERLATGEMIAAQGGSGLELGTGSLADMIAQNAYYRELDILATRRSATAEANALYQSSRDKRKAGNMAMAGAILSAGSAALNGINDMRQQSAVKRQTQKERGYQLGGGTVLTKRAPPVRVMGPPL
jgi:hypothetical protein